MATYTKSLISGSANGQGIQITDTNTAGGVNIHTATSGTAIVDEVWIYAVNTHTIPVKLTLEYGGKTAVRNTITQTIPINSGLYMVVSGLLLNNSLSITAFADVANVVSVYGNINRIS